MSDKLSQTLANLNLELPKQSHHQPIASTSNHEQATTNASQTRQGRVQVTFRIPVDLQDRLKAFKEKENRRFSTVVENNLFIQALEEFLDRNE